MASKAQFQAVLADYSALLSGGNNALEQQNRIRDYLRSFSEDEYHTVLLQVLAYINRDVGWRFTRIDGERVVPEYQLAQLTSNLFQYRGYGRHDYSAGEGYRTFIDGDILPTPGSANFLVQAWRTPDVLVAPVAGTYQHGDQSFNLVSTVAGNAVLVVPPEVVSATLRIQRYTGTLANQANAAVVIGGTAMVGNTYVGPVTGGFQIDVNGAGGGVYDVVTATFTNVRVARVPQVVDGLGKRIFLMARVGAPTLASRTQEMVLNAARAPDVAALFRINDLRATAPLWHCADELLDIASAGRV